MKAASWIVGALAVVGVMELVSTAQQPAEQPRKRPLAMLLAPVVPTSPAAHDVEPGGEKPVKRASLLQAPVVPMDAPASAGPSGLTAGGSFYYLKPYVQGNTAFVTTINPGQPNSQVISDSFHWDFQPTFAGWIGWTGPSGLGVRARYFQFDHHSSDSTLSNAPVAAPQTQTTINPPLANLLPLSTGGTAFGSPSTTLNTGFGVDQLSFGSDLKIHSIDLEATCAWKCGHCFLLAFAGGRYLDMEQNYHATLANNGGGAAISEVQTLDAFRRFSGGGPTLGLQGNVPFGRSGLSLFALGRGSLLVGSTRESVVFSQIVNDPTGLVPGHVPPPATLEINPTGSRSSDHVMPIAELELGLEYGRQVGRTWWFFRGAAVNQTYFSGGSASQASGNLSLFGIQASVGINY